MLQSLRIRPSAKPKLNLRESTLSGSRVVCSDMPEPPLIASSAVAGSTP